VEQEDLFFETVADALDGAIRATGGHKAVALDLWPSLKLDTAYARLKAAINPDKAEKLSPDEVVWLLKRAREKGHHAAFYWLCDELGYSRPAPVDPTDQAAELARQLEATADRFEAITARLARLKGSP
jgi:hypothetical protein